MNIAIHAKHPGQPCQHRLARALAPTALAVSLMLAFSCAKAAPVLPDPESTFDGIPVALQHNDFYSYSGSLMQQWGFITQAEYQGGGTGGLDLILGTGPGGASSNLNTGPDSNFNFESAMDFPQGGGAANSSFTGSWGDGSQANGPVLVDNLLSYLQAFDPMHSIPVFIFDHNQQGGNPDLLIRAEIYIWDPVGQSKVAQWFFDDGLGGYVESAGNISVTGDSGTTYTANNNTGSGRIDFLAYAPTMDLSLYTGSDYWFVGDFEMASLNNGYEELFLTGRIGTPTVSIPEPGVLALLGIGLIGIGMGRRKV